MTLKELMQLCYNAGRDEPRRVRLSTFGEWWEKYGQERHDDFADALDDVPMERLVDPEDP